VGTFDFTAAYAVTAITGTVAAGVSAGAETAPTFNQAHTAGTFAAVVGVEEVGAGTANPDADFTAAAAGAAVVGVGAGVAEPHTFGATAAAQDYAGTAARRAAGAGAEAAGAGATAFLECLDYSRKLDNIAAFIHDTGGDMKQPCTRNHAVVNKLDGDGIIPHVTRQDALGNKHFAG